MKIEVVTERRGEIERIQREFKGKLSEREILKATAASVNDALRRSIPKINKGIKAEYNISQKYLSRQAIVSPKASSSQLWGGVKVNEMPLPVIAFKPKQSGSSISVAFHKGKPTFIRDAFIATVRGKGSGGNHEGVFSRGSYQKRSFEYGREKTSSGRIRITQRMGPAVFSMARHKKVADDVQGFMGEYAEARVEGILRGRVDKIAKGK